MAVSVASCAPLSSGLVEMITVVVEAAAHCGNNTVQGLIR